MLLGELLKHAHDLIDDPHTNIPERLYEDLTGDAYYQLLLKREEPVEEALLMQYKNYLNRYLKGEPYQYIKAAGQGNTAAISAVRYIDSV